MPIYTSCPDQITRVPSHLNNRLTFHFAVWKVSFIFLTLLRLGPNKLRARLLECLLYSRLMNPFLSAFYLNTAVSRLRFPGDLCFYQPHDYITIKFIEFFHIIDPRSVIAREKWCDSRRFANRRQSCRSVEPNQCDKECVRVCEQRGLTRTFKLWNSFM